MNFCNDANNLMVLNIQKKLIIPDIIVEFLKFTY